MQEEIKEILDKLQKVANRETASRNALMEMKDKDYQLLLDYITNLQEELEEEKRIEKESLKTIQNLEEDNKQLKELCDKYEEEHKTTFEEWKKNIQANKKAIEYIELGLANEEEAEELLNILKRR